MAYDTKCNPNPAARPIRGALLRRRAISLTELLVVLLIIGLMTSIAVPGAMSRVRQGRIAKARGDAAALAQAEEDVAAQHGFYVPLQVLDDLPDDPGNTRVNVDMITREPSQVRLTDVNIPLDAVTPLLQVDSSDIGRDPRANDVFRDWMGPFINFQDFFDQDPASQDQSSTLRDYPLDPWGTPYFLYSQRGIVGSGARAFQRSTNRVRRSDMANPNFSNGDISPGTSRFDRWAVVSFGPDRFAGSPNAEPPVSPSDGLGDDIVIFFGDTMPGEIREPDVDIDIPPSPNPFP